MMWRNKIFYIVLVSFLLSQVKAQSDAVVEMDSSENKTTLLPLVFFLPETGFGFGGTGISTFRFKNELASSPVSRVSYVAAYTLKRQLLLIVPFELYQKNGKIRHKGELGFYKFFYNYFGIGPEAREEDLEIYDVLIPRVEYNYVREFTKKWSVGIGFKFDDYDITGVEADGLLDIVRPLGVDGGIKLNSVFVARYDSRNNYIRTSRGFATEVQFERSINFLADFDYWRLNINSKLFIPIKGETVLGLDMQFFSSPESTPFFDLAHMGKFQFARGFSDRRFIDRNMLNFQYELRFPLYKRLKGNTFASVTYLNDEFNAIFDFQGKFAVGAGLRFLLNPEELTSVAFDVGYGDKFNFYLTVNEAF